MKSKLLLPSLISYTSPDGVAHLSSSCRDVETLAQRVKRAKVSAGGQPPVGTSGAPLVVLSSPDSSPRHSPQRKFVTLPPVDTCLGNDTLVLTLPGMQEESSSRRSHRGLLPTRRPHRPRRPEGRPRQGRQAPGPRTWRRRRRTWAPAALPRRQMLAGRGLPFPSLVPALVSRSLFVPVLSLSGSWSWPCLTPFFGAQIPPR